MDVFIAVRRAGSTVGDNTRTPMDTRDSSASANTLYRNALNIRTKVGGSIK
jgi:hypothetical protein